MKRLDHNNIMQMYEIYIDYINAKVYMVMEFIKGKKLFETI